MKQSLQTKVNFCKQHILNSDECIFYKLFIQASTLFSLSPQVYLNVSKTSPFLNPLEINKNETNEKHLEFFLTVCVLKMPM